jgi:hypothetical protein
MWRETYKNIQEKIKLKVNFLNKKETEIDLTKPDKYNQAIIKRLAHEREFINDLIAFLYETEKHISYLENSNKHLSTQNAIYFHLVNTYEAEFENEYGRSIREIIQK